MGKVTKKLGLLSEIMGYILTYGGMVAIYYPTYIILEKERFDDAIFIVIMLLLVFIIWHFVGKILYTLYGSYLKYINKEKTLKKFKIQWYASFSILIIFWSLFIVLLIGYTIGIKDSKKNLMVSLASFVFVPLIIPQTILHYKTFGIVTFLLT